MHRYATAIITATEITKTGRIFLQLLMFRSIDRSLRPTGCMPRIIFSSLVIFMPQGRRTHR